MRKPSELLFLCIVASSLTVACSSQYAVRAASQTAPPPTAPVQTIPKNAPQPHPVRYETKKTQIVSEPPGARIEVNSDYVGDAPVTVELPQRGYYFAEDVTIRALPTEGGDYTQEKHFTSNDPWYHPYHVGSPDKVPSRIFFNMHLGPVTPEMDVNHNPPN